MSDRPELPRVLDFIDDQGPVCAAFLCGREPVTRRWLWIVPRYCAECVSEGYRRSDLRHSWREWSRTGWRVSARAWLHGATSGAFGGLIVVLVTR